MTIDSASDEQSALAAAWRLQRSGNFVAAFDIAQEALQHWPGSQVLQHVAILALASCGSTRAALAAFAATSLAATGTEDYLAIEARLLKDLAFQSDAAEPKALFVQAARAYEQIAERTGGSYSAQNAALLWLLAGDTERGTRLAGVVVEGLAGTCVPADEQAAYFHWATLAEAALVLNDRDALAQAVARADPLCRRNLWARTRTFAQMRRLVGCRPECAGIVEQWYRPAVGLVLRPGQILHAPASRDTDEDCEIPALAYAAGPAPEDEWHALAAQGVQLHVILADAASGEARTPSRPATNRQASGHCAAYTWSSLLLDEGDDNQRACVETALGLSLGQANALYAPWAILERPDGRWRRCREDERRALCAAIAPVRTGSAGRGPYGFLFADAVGYSSLNAADTRQYWSKLLPDTGAAVLRRHSKAVLLRKTWGDAVHGVFRTASDAALAALEMTAATERLAEELEFGRRLAFRVAAHFGAADRGIDPVEETLSYFGPQLSFAARIVPVAPPGGVFVTEPFAAQLSLEGAAGIDCRYVGTTSLAKSYGRVRLLALSYRS